MGFTSRAAAMVLLLAIPAISSAQDKESKPAAGEKSSLSQAELEKQFSDRMAKSVMVGKFTIDGKEDGDPKEERYEIESVTKTNGDYWTFLARIKYGKVDTKIPITVKMLWAGDTPMISMTDFTIPGMGTFTARVLFYEDRYAGTWQHGKVGGHMFGKIEKAKPAAE
jgi:hypothetical protein